MAPWCGCAQGLPLREALQSLFIIYRDKMIREASIFGVYFLLFMLIAWQIWDVHAAFVTNAALQNLLIDQTIDMYAMPGALNGCVCDPCCRDAVPSCAVHVAGGGGVGGTLCLRYRCIEPPVAQTTAARRGAQLVPVHVYKRLLLYRVCGYSVCGAAIGVPTSRGGLC